MELTLLTLLESRLLGYSSCPARRSTFADCFQNCEFTLVVVLFRVCVFLFLCYSFPLLLCAYYIYGFYVSDISDASIWMYPISALQVYNLGWRLALVVCCLLGLGNIRCGHFKVRKENIGQSLIKAVIGINTILILMLSVLTS